MARSRARKAFLLRLAVLGLVLGLTPALTLSLLVATPVHAKKRGPTLPKAFLGQWSAEKDKCDIQSESRLVIEPDFVMFYAAGYSVRRIVKRRDGSLKIFGPRVDEGEGGSTPDSVELKLISPDVLQTNGSDRPTYYRCKDAKPATP